MRRKPIEFGHVEGDIYSPLADYLVYWNDHLASPERHFHAAKFFGVPGGEEIIELIYNAHSAYEAKLIARSHRHRRQKNWRKIRVRIMEEINWEKANQFFFVRDMVLATGSAEIVEKNSRDPFWGTGRNGKGRNEQGKTWMRIRERLRKEEEG